LETRDFATGAESRANARAWEFFNRQPPSYRRLALYR